LANHSRHLCCKTLAQAPYRNRKKVISQNVLGVCSFAMSFFYVLAGYEGSAHDATVLEKAMRLGFAIPPGCFMLGDAAYGITPWLMTPYRGVRYHLKEWATAFSKGQYVHRISFRRKGMPSFQLYVFCGRNLIDLRRAHCHRIVQTAQELYNLRHAQLRNVIERIFGVMKKRFPILVQMREYDIDTQIDIVYACVALHNFLAKHGGEDEVYVEWDAEWRADPPSVRRKASIGEDGTVLEEEEEERITTNVTSEQRERGQAMRDRIAERMWRQYQRRTAAEKRAERARFAQEFTFLANQGK
jgi:hypothetical protein